LLIGSSMIGVASLDIYAGARYNTSESTLRQTLTRAASAK
jgi:hypothetical protein